MRVAVEIVSPERLILSREIDMTVIPATDGEVGVLVGHADMIVLLRGGTVRLYENNDLVETLFVSGGFAQVTSSTCTILTAGALRRAEISPTDAQARFIAAEAAYEAADKINIHLVDAALTELQSAAAMLEFASAS